MSEKRHASRKVLLTASKLLRVCTYSRGRHLGRYWPNVSDDRRSVDLHRLRYRRKGCRERLAEPCAVAMNCRAPASYPELTMHRVTTLTLTAAFLVAASSIATAQSTLDVKSSGGAVNSSKGAVNSVPSAVNSAPSAAEAAPSAVDSSRGAVNSTTPPSTPVAPATKPATSR